MISCIYTVKMIRSAVILRTASRNFRVNKIPLRRTFIREQSTLSLEVTEDGYAGKSQPKLNVSNTPIEKYKDLINDKILKPDNHQFRIISKLNDLHTELTTYQPSAIIELDERINAKTEDLPWVSILHIPLYKAQVASLIQVEESC